uniref:uncharacterized protein LOC117266159 isoform X1 n=1 Tax=Epinephelus lanceolatus TaxID=310571 RepID=UPI001444D5A3|nr:uncharacterized protein LOC117266159 isoform X1 [Epinephelus lanceolatus]
MMTPAVVFVLLVVLGQTSGHSDQNIVIPGRPEYLTLCEVEVNGQPSGNTPNDQNIARGGRVTQSSLGWHGLPERAIDGSRASIYGQGSCTHTSRQRKPWWRLDLLKTYKINTVTITNRKDCCHKRINGAEIHIGNSLNDNGNANPRCAVIQSIPAGTSKTFVCNGMEGQYVNIVIPGRPEYLTLCEVEVNGQPSGNTPNDQNIARGGRVTQSSLGWHGLPERAIDGSRASIYGQGSCTHTSRQRKPWWRLDLLKTYKINTVTITNRKDCCHKRINGAEIHIGNSLNDNGNANPRCAVIQSIPAGTSKTFVCNGMEGQYVNIVIPGRPEYLTLCEVEVNGQPSGNTPNDQNIARGGRVTQSSLGWHGLPERAIDGSRASIYGQGSCTHTSRQRKPWWRLDLLKTYKINTVTITNRKDCCHKRINGAEIHIGNSLNDNGNANPRCAVIQSIPAGTSKTFVCNGMEGQYVNIVIPGRPEYLTLCEVEVNGQPSGNTPNGANIAKGGKATQSSVGWDGPPENAIDGNRASIYGQGSCTHTQGQIKPWWRLDLLKKYKIDTVTITNRKDCCHSRLNGAEIRIGNSLNDNGNANPRCAIISSIAAGTSKTFACDLIEGQYVNIVIPGRKEYLTLCEVEVTGIESDDSFEHPYG